MKKIVDSTIELKAKVYESFVKVTNVQNDLTAIDSKILSKLCRVDFPIKTIYCCFFQIGKFFFLLFIF